MNKIMVKVEGGLGEWIASSVNGLWIVLRREDGWEGWYAPTAIIDAWVE